MSGDVRPIEERRLLGIGLVLGAFLMFTGIDTAAKWLAGAGLPTMEIVFMRYAVHLALVVGFLFPTRRAALVRTKSLRLELARGLCLMGSTILNFLALRYLPLTVTASIFFSMPLIISALSVPLLGEQVGWRRWTAILVGFLGVLVIVRPGTDAFHPAALLSLAAATTSALYFLLTRRLAGVDSVGTQQFYAALVATLCVAPFAFGGWVWPEGWTGWLAFFGVGVAGVVGHQLSTIAHRLAPASVLAPFAYFQIVYMTASSWFIFHQPPDVWIFVGAPIVVGSGLYLWLRERTLAKPVVTEVAPQD